MRRDGNYAAVRPGSSMTGGDKMQMTDRNGNTDKLNQMMDEYGKGPVCIAFSGGVDSSLLLKIACDNGRKYKTPVYAVTFNTMLHQGTERIGDYQSSCPVPYHKAGGKGAFVRLWHIGGIQAVHSLYGYASALWNKAGL